MKKILTVLATAAMLSNSVLAEPSSDKKEDHKTFQVATEEDSNWVVLGEHSGSEYLLQKDSLKLLTYKSGMALRMTMQTNTPKSIHYSNLYFWANSCKQKQGELAYFNLSNTESHKAMVVVGGKDVGSKAVTIMCNDYENYEAHLMTLSEQEQKENEEWKDIAITDKIITSYKRGSAKAMTIQNKPGIEMLGRVVDLNLKKVTLQNWSVSSVDCKSEVGVLNIHDISTRANTINNFSFHSGSMASLIAEDLCSKLGNLPKDENKPAIAANKK